MKTDLYDVKRSAIINNELALVENMQAKIKMCKPITVGYTMLEIAKFTMYQLYYDCLLPKSGDRLHMFYRHWQFHLSHTERGPRRRAWQHRSPMTRHLKFRAWTSAIFRCQFPDVGEVKSETADIASVEFCGLHLEMYSLLMLSGTKDYRKAKGVPKTFVKQNVRHEQYLDVLHYWTKTSCSYMAFHSWNHRIVTRRHEKVCLSCINDKHHLLPDCVHSLAYGHYSIVDDACATFVYYFVEYQPQFELYENHVQFCQGKPRMGELESLSNVLLIVDDLMSQVDEDLMCLFTRGSHHRNVSILFSLQNFFLNNKYMRTISLNAQYIVLFKTPCNNSQFAHLAKQLYPQNSHFVLEAYLDATKDRYGYLLLDLRSEQDEDLRLHMCIFPGDQQVVYVPKSIK